jgi:hypothetical protein
MNTQQYKGSQGAGLLIQAAVQVSQLADCPLLEIINGVMME